MASPGGASDVVQPSSSSFTGETMEPKCLTTQELHQITDNLSLEKLIGQGAFGKVYKGVLDDEDIAVKVLNDNLRATEDEEFQHEFDNLVMLNHPNIVRLVAYCFETQRPRMGFEGRSVFAESTRRALCFEFMHKGSLQGHISDESHGLDWKTRYTIIKGACEGLKYLHGLREPILHLDLKPDNILLDENMVPKLADFGLSKLCGAEQTRVTQAGLGTIGYMPPEYLFYGLISNKVDIFSMGAVITKIIAGPEGPKRIAETSNQEFLDQVYENWRKRLEATCTFPWILDAYCEQVSICTEIGLNSMETERAKRPSIMEINERLDRSETLIDQAISRSANSRLPSKSQRKKDDDLVKVEGFARNKAIHFTEACDEFPVLVRVTGAPWRRAEEMPGVDVVLAFNLGMEQLKKIVMVLVDRLRPNDRVSFLFWGISGMEHLMELTFMSDHGRDVARLRINELAQSHAHEKSVYIGPALAEAAQILRHRGVEESGSRAGCILHVWHGRMSPEIHKQDISQEFPVHTIAIGEHEPRDMNQIADMTSGTYTSLKYRQDFLELQALGLFSTSITSVAPKSVRITLQAHQGITISSITSGRYLNLVNSDKQSATVHLHSIYAGEQKTFIVYLTVPRGKQKLVTISDGYQSKKQVGMDVDVLRPRRKCLPDEVVINPKVAAELLRIRLMEGIANGNQDLSRNNLQLLLDDIKNSDEGRAAPEEILSDLEEEVTEMTDRYGEDRESMLSSLDRHQLQHSSTNGTPLNINAFQIREQQQEDAHTNLVKLQGFTSSKAILRRKTGNEFPVLVRVSVAPWCHGWEMPRDCLDVVVVLDISEKMQSGMLELVKQAMMIVIDKLGPKDRLSIVSFQTREHRLMELTYMSDDHDHGRDASRFNITQLKASSEAYMGDIASATIEEGAQILRGRGAEECITRQGCMMLLSDGNYPEILQRKISTEFPVHTFGLGVDHNPKVMKYIADMTFRTYSYADQYNIKEALMQFITGLTSVAATSITITLRAHFEIVISSIESGNYIHHVESNKMSGTIIIDHIYAGEKKEFIVNLIVGTARKELLTIGGQYKILERSKSFAEMDITVLRPWIKSSLDDLDIHADVAAELTRIRLQNGVLEMLKTQKMTTQGLQKLWDMIKDSNKGRGAPEETLATLAMDVAEMNRDISGTPYTLSWLSCHNWQRATTKGTPNNSRAFQTIGQYADQDTDLVKVQTINRSKAIPSDDPCNNFPVLLRVMAAPQRQAEEMPCAGVDVVAVLDASAGMQGEKLEHMKEAMTVVIGKLRAEDRLSIVSFSTYENRLTRLTYMTDQGRDVARLKIGKLVAGGQGNIAATVREGAEILWWREADSIQRVGCIVLLSDCKNFEISETEIRPEFPVHTFGMGTDHDPSMMKYIADVTNGTYSFVNEDIGLIKDALRFFITSLTSVVAMSIKLTLRTNEGITISSVESGGYVNHVKNKQFGTIDIDSIYAGEQKDFIVYLRVAEGKKDLLTIGGRYLSHITVKHLAYTDVCVQHPHQEGLQDDLAIHPDVAAELVRIRLEKGISNMLENGTSTVGLQQLWEEIMDTDEGRAMPLETLLGLSIDVTEMKRDIEDPKEYRKSGLPYTLSWLTSRKWQRATTKGTPCSSDAFQTTGQDADGRATLSQQTE